MSNKLINAIIAMIEDRPSIAREILRSPELNIPIGEVQARLSKALTKIEGKAIVQILKNIVSESLRLDPKETSTIDTPEKTKDFLLGVIAVEEIIDRYIDIFEPEAVAQPSLEN